MLAKYLMQIPSINNVSNPIPIITNSQPYIATLNQAKTTSTSTSSINNAVTHLNNFFANSTSLTFHIDDTTDSVVIKVIDTISNQMISQMPTEQALVMSRLINSQSTNHTGLLVKNMA